MNIHRIPEKKISKESQEIKIAMHIDILRSDTRRVVGIESALSMGLEFKETRSLCFSNSFDPLTYGLPSRNEPNLCLCAPI